MINSGVQEDKIIVYNLINKISLTYILSGLISNNLKVVKTGWVRIRHSVPKKVK